MQALPQDFSNARIAVLIFGLVLAGCGSPPPSIRGQVTLDGEPLAGATLAFIPTLQDADAVVARTDQQGQYTIEAGEGFELRPGGYRVRITTYDEGNRDVMPPILPVPERVPAKYNVESTLTVEVKPDLNEFDFPLDSKGRIEPR